MLEFSDEAREAYLIIKTCLIFQNVNETEVRVEYRRGLQQIGTPSTGDRGRSVEKVFVLDCGVDLAEVLVLGQPVVHLIFGADSTHLENTDFSIPANAWQKKWDGSACYFIALFPFLQQL